MKHIIPYLILFFSLSSQAVDNGTYICRRTDGDPKTYTTTFFDDKFVSVDNDDGEESIYYIRNKKAKMIPFQNANIKNNGVISFDYKAYRENENVRIEGVIIVEPSYEVLLNGLFVQTSENQLTVLNEYTLFGVTDTKKSICEKE